jgi:lysophospholipase L1-like esterase
LNLKKYCKGEGWKVHYSYRENSSDYQQFFGLASLESTQDNSYLWLDFRLPTLAVSKLNGVDIAFSKLRSNQSAIIGLTIDNEPERLVNLSSDVHELIQVRSQKTISVLKLRVIVGSVTLEGFAPQYASSQALYFDTMGIPSSTINGWEKMDAKELKRHPLLQDYDIVMLQYGTNEGNMKYFDEDNYRKTLKTAVSNLKTVYPHALCILIGAPDRGVLVRRSDRHRQQPVNREVLYYSNTHETINQIQREVGLELSCATWDWQNAMGGRGAAYNWFYQSPKLMAGDLTHLSILGYQMSARMFENWLGLRR